MRKKTRRFLSHWVGRSLGVGGWIGWGVGIYAQQAGYKRVAMVLPFSVLAIVVGTYLIWFLPAASDD